MFNLKGFNSFMKYREYIVYVIILYVGIFYLFGMYKTRKGFLIEVDEFIQAFFSVALAWGLLIILTFIRGETQYSRPVILLSWPITFFAIALVRGVILKFELTLRKKGYGNLNAAIIGSDDFARSVADRIEQHPSYGVRFIGFIGESKYRCLGKLEDLMGVVSNHKIKFLYVTDKKMSRKKLLELAAFCDENRLYLGTIPDVFQILTTSPNIENITGLPIVSLRSSRLTPFSLLLKRFFDIFFALFFFFILFIPILLITFLIKLVSPDGPVIYKQERVGMGGRVFFLYKFRTMVPHAEKNTGPVFAQKADPRNIKFGSLLRYTRFDEIPQIINILKGDMSFVGPRPERPVFVHEYSKNIPKYFERHKIMPGLAGWAQLHGGYHMPAEEKIKYDLYYIENWSLLLDLKISLRCLQIVLSFSGGT